MAKAEVPESPEADAVVEHSILGLQRSKATSVLALLAIAGGFGAVWLMRATSCEPLFDRTARVQLMHPDRMRAAIETGRLSEETCQHYMDRYRDTDDPSQVLLDLQAEFPDLMYTDEETEILIREREATGSP